MELWIKYNDLSRAKWSELLASSICYQAALKLPPHSYEIRIEIGGMVIIGQEILTKFSLERLHSWKNWLDEQGYKYDHKFHLFGKEEILKKEFGIF